MKKHRLSLYFVVFASSLLAACSGPSHFGGTGGNGGGTGNATLSLMVTAQPEAATTLPSHSTLAILTTITGITLTPSSGNPVNLTLTPASFPVNLLSTQSGGDYLGTFSVPAGTYDSITLTFGTTAVTFYNSSGSTISAGGINCATLTVCRVAPQTTSSSAQVQSSPLPLTLTSGQETGLALQFIAGNALSFTNGAVTINYSAQNAVEAVALPRTGNVASPSILDTIENFTGEVTAFTAPSGSTAGSITLTSNAGTSLNASVSSTVTINDPQALCGQTATVACLTAHNNAIVSVDAELNSSGTLTVTEADLLFLQAQDELQGYLFFPANTTNYTLAVTNKIVGSDNVLANADFGDVYTMTFANNSTFAIDSEDTPLLTQFPSLASLFTSPADLYSGQSIMVHVTALANTSITVDQVLLRFSNLSAIVNTAAGPGGTTFTVTQAGITPSIFLQQLVNNAPPVVQTFENTTQNTILDGVSSINSLAVGDSISLRALFLPNSTEDFYAAKVRDNTKIQ